MNTQMMTPLWSFIAAVVAMSGGFLVLFGLGVLLSMIDPPRPQMQWFAAGTLAAATIWGVVVLILVERA